MSKEETERTKVIYRTANHWHNLGKGVMKRQRDNARKIVQLKDGRVIRLYSEAQTFALSQQKV